MNAAFVFLALVLGTVAGSSAVRAGDLVVMVPDKVDASGNYQLFFGTGSATDSVVVCVETPTCEPGSQSMITTRLVAIRGDRKIFISNTSLAVKVGSINSASALTGQTPISHLKFQFVAIQSQPIADPQAVPPIEIAAERVKLQDMSFAIPAGWKVHQDAEASGMLLLGLTNGTDYLRLYVKRGPPPDMQTMFVNGSTVTKQPYSEQIGAATWRLIETDKRGVKVTGFTGERNGYAYFGYVSAKSRQAEVIKSLLQSSR